MSCLERLNSLRLGLFWFSFVLYFRPKAACTRIFVRSVPASIKQTFHHTSQITARSTSASSSLKWSSGFVNVFVSRTSALTLNLDLALAQHTFQVQLVRQDYLTNLVSSYIHEQEKLWVLVGLDELDVFQRKIHCGGARKESSRYTGAVFEFHGDWLVCG